MSNKGGGSRGGIGFTGLLTILFVGLKLTGYIDWSWWWVVSPLWISFALGAFMLLLWLALELQDRRQKRAARVLGKRP